MSLSSDESVQGLISKIGNKTLILQPEYQRYYVWGPKKESLLIDSILRGYTIPPIWVWRHEDANGDLIEEIIDGQQRLTCIKRYFDDYFPFTAANDQPEASSIDGLKKAYYDKVPSDKKGIILTPEQQKIIKIYKLHLIVLEDHSDAEIRALFKRLNSTGNTLTNQELRNATFKGHFKQYIYSSIVAIQGAQIKKATWLSKNKRVFKKAQRDRMGAQQFLSEIVVAMESGIQNQTDKVEEIYETYDASWPKTAQDRIKNNISKCFETIYQAFYNEQTTLITRKSDFYSLVLAIHYIQEHNAGNINIHSEKNRLAIKDSLLAFTQCITKYADDKKQGKIAEDNEIKLFETYLSTISMEVNKKYQRARRTAILVSMIEPALTEHDTQRLFSKGQKNLIWNMSPQKVCKLCKNKVENFEDYQPDHITPHSKGGRTTLTNGQITHATCNKIKGNKDKVFSAPITQKFFLSHKSTLQAVEISHEDSTDE